MHFRAITVFFLAILVSACGTVELSKSELKSVKAGNKAIIKTYNQPLAGSVVFKSQPVVQILSVDGKKVKSHILKLDEQIAVSVGKHAVEFACVNRARQDDRDFTEIMTLDIKAHHEYLVRCSFNSKFGPNGTYTGDFSVKEKPLKQKK